MTTSLGLALSLLFGILALVPGDRPSSLNDPFFDHFQRMEPREYNPEIPVRIVAIDGESVNRYGQWPWPRVFFAELVRRLSELGAAVIVFDVVFTEPDRTSPELLEQAINRFDSKGRGGPAAITHSSHDASFAEALSAAPVVLGVLPKSSAGALPPARSGIAIAGADPTAALVRFESADLPIGVLMDSAAGLGAAGLGDGTSVTIRRTPLFVDIGGEIAPSLAAEALRVAQGVRGYVLKSSAPRAGSADAVTIGARIGGIEMPLSGDGTLWVRYAGPRAERTLPAWRVLEGDRVDPELARLVQGQIVLVGATAPGLRYVVATPLSQVADGVSVHAEVLEQILAGEFLYRPDWAPPAEALLTIALCLAMTLVLRAHRPLLGTGFATGGTAVILAVSWKAFDDADMLLGPAWPVLGLGVTFAALTLANYFRSDAERQAVRGQFERFVSAEVIAKIMEDPRRHLSPAGELRDLTVMFMDVRNFSKISERMAPDLLIQYLNEFFGPFTEEILAAGGTLDKYIGDAIMAFWNAPLDQPDHPTRAVAATLAMRRALRDCNARLVARGLPKMRFGVGLNSGPCSVGSIGTSRRLDYSCIGDAVNLASRLEQLSKTYGIWNCIGDSTARAAVGFTLVEIDTVTVKGRQRPEPFWMVLGDAGVGERPEVGRLISAIGETRAAIAAGDIHAARKLVVSLPAMSVPELNTSGLAAAYTSKINALMVARDQSSAHPAAPRVPIQQ